MMSLTRYIRECVAAVLLGTAMGTVAQGYEPEGRAFVCENGNNRYTRALYGGPTDYRVETSDRPIFAVVKKGHHRNIRFVVNGVPLETADYCKASYEEGSRKYLLRDPRWDDSGLRQLRLEVVALQDEEGAVFAFEGAEASQPLDVKVLLTNIAQPKLFRNGDLGADPPGVFDPAPHDEGLVEGTAIVAPQEPRAYVLVRLDELAVVPFRQVEDLYERTVSYYHELASRVEFNTPDPYINTLGGALVMAADGDWDGETWLHGCVGWRMPLAGWRAGYLGDVLGWPDRAVSHFNAYAKSQVRNVSATIPHPTQDEKQRMARAEKRWGTQMYSDGYICRYPNRNDQMHHYDMNLNYVDELLWHFQYDADEDYLRQMWPVLERHLAWEKRNYDPDGDHLYDAYCCIWASDALYYSGGAVTHSSAYNYRANRLAARIAERIGKNPQPYRQEADAILDAMNRRLWLEKDGHWAEYEDLMGQRRLHESAAVWSVYTPIDCGACSPRQAWLATKYVDRAIPHIDVADTGLRTIATSNWMPYAWSINNVAAAEVMHTALAYFLAGRAEEGYRLMKANIMDQMYLGQSPGNFGQISKYDAARGECYRDFGDCIGISARTLIQGFFGIQPDALNDRCIIRPSLPATWNEASVTTPYLSYRYRRVGNKDVYEVTQHFRRPLKIVIRQNLGGGEYRDTEGTTDEHQVIRVETPVTLPMPEWESGLVTAPDPSADEPSAKGRYQKQNLSRLFNASVTDIFRNEYRSPRPPYTTLQIPVQGVGEWCHPAYTPDINDSVFRSLIVKDEFTVKGVPFRTPAEGQNIIFTSLWDNYPDSTVVPLNGSASQAWLLMAGSTNHMQSRIANGVVVARYKDGTADSLLLVNPDNWCPIEQDYYVDGRAFSVAQPRPYRVAFGTGTVSRDLGSALSIQGVYGREIPGGAATMLRMPLDRRKRLQSLTVRTLSNDVVIGLMAVTLQ